MSSLSKVVLKARVNQVGARARAIKVELHVLVAICKAFFLSIPGFFISTSDGDKLKDQKKEGNVLERK